MACECAVTVPDISVLAHFSPWVRPKSIYGLENTHVVTTITAVSRRIGPVAVADNGNIFAVFTIVLAHSL